MAFKRETTRLYGRAKINRSDKCCRCCTAMCCNAGACCKQAVLAHYVTHPDLPSAKQAPVDPRAHADAAPAQAPSASMDMELAALNSQQTGRPAGSERVSLSAAATSSVSQRSMPAQAPHAGRAASTPAGCSPAARVPALSLSPPRAGRRGAVAPRAWARASSQGSLASTPEAGSKQGRTGAPAAAQAPRTRRRRGCELAGGHWAAVLGTACGSGSQGSVGAGGCWYSSQQSQE